MSQDIIKSKFNEQLLYEIYNSEDEIMNEPVECRHNCRYCKSIDECEFGMFSNSL